MLSSAGFSTSTSAQGDSNSGRQVNNLLHALRGEQFRHAQNVAHRRTRQPTTTSLMGSLPPLRPASGPAAPKSWTRRDDDVEALQDGPAYRADAFRVLFDDIDVPSTARDPSTPMHENSLVHLCLRVLLDLPAEVALPVLAELPAHLRRHVMLHTAVHAPMPGDVLRILLADEGNISGEVVLGRAYPPGWLVRSGILHLHATTTSNAADPGSDSDPGPSSPSREDDWDASSDGWSDGDTSSPPLHTLALLTHQLSPAHISSLPSSLTRLALLAQPQPLPLHRLPALLPHLVLLDISFNMWLGAPYVDVEAALDDAPPPAEEGGIWKSAVERIEWVKWRRLAVLGLRECGLVKEMQEGVVRKVQMGRLEDVTIYS